MNDLTYEASVYTRTVKYKNFKGDTSSTILYFALDPLQLMQVIAGFEPKKVKSGNPMRNNKDAEITPEEQLKFVRDLASKAAGFPSEDGEAWEPFEDFSDTIAGKAFLTQLASSDADRKEFCEKVILAPFDAFVQYATNDPSNSQKEIQQFKTMLDQMRNIFTDTGDKDESLEERRLRLAEELKALDSDDSDG